MRNPISINGKQVTIALTVAILAVFAAWYYFAYIPDNEKDLYQQHFRWLQKTDSNIRTKVDAIDSMLSSLFHNVDDRHNFYKDSGRFNNIYSTTDATIYVNLKHIPGSDLHKKSEPLFSVRGDSSSGKLLISACRLAYGDSITFTAAYNYDQFFKPVLEQGTFDHYVIFYNGRYIYEDFHSGLGYDVLHEDSLLRIGKWTTGSNIMDQEVGGTQYKMFLQPVNFFGSKRLILAGLHSQKKFNAEKKQLPANKALLAIIIALAILLLFPWIRLYFIGKYERLTLINAAESLVVAKLLMSVLLLFLFKYSFTVPGNYQRSCRALSTKISAAFHAEMGSAYHYLGQFDSIMYSGQIHHDLTGFGNLGTSLDTVNGKKRKETLNLNTNNLSSSNAHALDSLFKEFPLTEVNWMDKDGNLLYNWTTTNHNSTHSNYRDRDYFKDITNNRTINPDDDSSVSFTIEPVISRSNGDFKTVLCKKSFPINSTSSDSAATVVLMDWNVKCLDSVIMPAGYSFAIIDKKGEVKYHSDQRKNLNENLVDEFSEKKELQEVLNGGFSNQFKTNYYESSYSVTASPISKYPYFIVVMSSSDFHDSVEVKSFAFSWGMILLFLLLVLIDLVILIVSSSRRSMFRMQSLVTSWLWPRKNSRNEYIVAGLGNIVMIIVVSFSFRFFDYLSCLFILSFSVPMVTIFMNSIFLAKYGKLKSHNDRFYKVRSARYSAIFLVFLNLVAFMVLYRDYIFTLLFEIVLGLAGWLLIEFYIRWPHWVTNIPKRFKPDYLRSFTFMAVTKLLVTSGVPAIFFYISSYNFDRNMLARNRLFDFYQQLKVKFHGEPLDTAMNYRNAVYIDGTWIDSMRLNPVYKCPVKQAKPSGTERMTATVFNSFGSFAAAVPGNDNDKFYLSSSVDSSYHFNDFFSEVLCKNKANELCATVMHRHDLLLKTAKLNYPLPKLFSKRGIEFWLIVLFALVVFYIILLDIVKRICSLDMRRLTTWETISEYPGKLFDPGMSLWIVGVEPTNVLDILLKELRKKWPDIRFDRDQCVVDFEEVSTVDATSIKNRLSASSNPYLFALHIENAKPDSLQVLLELKKHLVIISSIHPIYLKATFPLNAFSNLPVMIKPLISTEVEREHAGFLNELKRQFPLKRPDVHSSQRELPDDHRVLKIQSLAYNFYASIWKSLSADEKFVLNDLAEDGLVNVKNRFAVNLLVNKGLIVADEGHLRIFNRSFRHFIISGTDSGSTKELEDLKKKGSGWSNMKIPLLIIVVAVFIFLSFSQEGTYTTLIGVLSSLTAGIPILLKLFSMMGVQNDPQSKTNATNEEGG